MINWLKNLFVKGTRDATIQPSTPWPKQNISEPVYAIERNMIEHPSRWKVCSKHNGILLCDSVSCNYKVVDIKNNLKFYGHTTRYSGYGAYGSHVSWTSTTQAAIHWATEDEKNYLCNAVRNMQDKKLERMERIRQVKKNKERQRLMEIYK